MLISQRPATARMLLNRLVIASLLSTSALTGVARAQTATWIDNSAQTWDTPSGWDTNAEPDANTDVIIPPADMTNGGVSIRVNTADAVARSIMINGGLGVWDGRLTVGGDVIATGANALMGVHGVDSNADPAQLTVGGVLNFDLGGGFSVYDDGILRTHGAVLSGSGAIGNINWFAAAVAHGGIFDNSGYTMTIGRAGHAYLHLYSNGTVLTTDLSIGVEAANATTMVGEGLLLIESGSTVTVTDTADIGDAGRGEVEVNTGGVFNTAIGRVATSAGGNGLVTVDGGTWHNGGTLTVGVEGEGRVFVQGGGALDTDSLTIGNQTQATGLVTVTGSGSMLDTGATTYIGYEGTGSLQVLDGAVADLGTTVNNDLMLGYTNSGNGSVRVAGGGMLNGTGGLFVGSAGAGHLEIDGAGSSAVFYTTTVGLSTGSTGNIVLTNGAELTINTSATLGYAGTANLDLSGGSIFTAGNLFVASSDPVSRGTVRVDNSTMNITGQLELATYGTAEMIVSNGGALATNDLLVAADSGSHGSLTLSNATWANGSHAVIGAGGAGLLSLMQGAVGNIGGDLTIGNAGGTGTSSLAIANGQLSVGGNLMQYANSTYSYVIGNGPTVGGHIEVAGTATIVSGAQLAVGFDGNVSVGDEFLILHAGGVTGTYTLINGGQVSAFLGIDAIYDPNTVTLVVTSSQDFTDVAATPNQIATAEGLQSLGAGNPLFDTIMNIATVDEARFAFDQLSGEVHASLKTALIDDSRFLRDAANNRIRAAFGDEAAAATPVLAYGPGGPELSAPDVDLLAVWGQGFGSWGKWDSDGNAARFSRDTAGMLLGADASLSDWRIGLMGGYSHTGFSLPDRASSGSADNYHLGLYGGTQWGNLAFRSGLAYTSHDIDTSRRPAFTGFSENLSGSHDAGTAQAFGEFGYRFDIASRTTLEPFANLAHVRHRTGAFTETAGTAALSAASQTIETTFTTLGLRASHGFTLGTVDVTARGMLGWRHAYGDTTPTSTHAFAGGDAFTVAGVPIGKDAALVEAGLDFTLTPTATLGITYAGQFASGTTDQAVKANLSVKF